MITFSLITCTYNAGHEIQRTLDSVLAQTYPAVEHLIVDGRSADDTVARAEAYRQRSAEAGNGQRVRVTAEP
ncbi:glycosyltransferase, partial [Bacillus pumilus]